MLSPKRLVFNEDEVCSVTWSAMATLYTTANSSQAFGACVFTLCFNQGKCNPVVLGNDLSQLFARGHLFPPHQCGLLQENTLYYLVHLFNVKFRIFLIQLKEKSQTLSFTMLNLLALAGISQIRPKFSPFHTYRQLSAISYTDFLL